MRGLAEVCSGNVNRIPCPDLAVIAQLLPAFTFRTIAAAGQHAERGIGRTEARADDAFAGIAALSKFDLLHRWGLSHQLRSRQTSPARTNFRHRFSGGRWLYCHKSPCR